MASSDYEGDTPAAIHPSGSPAWATRAAKAADDAALADEGDAWREYAAGGDRIALRGLPGPPPAEPAEAFAALRERAGRACVTEADVQRVCGYLERLPMEA